MNLPVLLCCEVPGSTLRATGLQVDESVSADSLILQLWKSFSCNMSTLELSSTKPGYAREATSLNVHWPLPAHVSSCFFPQLVFSESEDRQKGSGRSLYIWNFVGVQLTMPSGHGRRYCELPKTITHDNPIDGLLQGQPRHVKRYKELPEQQPCFPHHQNCLRFVLVLTLDTFSNRILNSMIKSWQAAYQVAGGHDMGH